MALLYLLAMLTICAAKPLDLSYKMLTFPQQTNTDRVTLTTSIQELNASSVCLRSFTELTRDHCLFSLSTPSAPNEITLFRQANGNMDLFIRNTVVSFTGLEYQVNTWHSICFTWDSVSGVAQVWIDGKQSSRKYVSSGSKIRGPIIIILGQDQDSHGGAFVAEESFVGMMSDVNVWDHAIPYQEIANYMENQNFIPGNVLDWRELEFQITGRVLVEEQSLL